MFVIDPVPLKIKTGSDVTLEVARRLQALLEASGASTQSTRSVIDANASEKVRAKRVGDLTADSVIILTAPKTGAPGRLVRIPSAADSAKLTGSRRLATALSTALGNATKPVAITSVTPGAVMRAANGPVAEVHLGNSSVQADATNFRDPNWADATARAIYDALGKLYTQ
jgi:N-acetylmuramoyl-L-alanine amidase